MGEGGEEGERRREGGRGNSCCKELVHLIVGLSSLKLAGQASRLESQVGFLCCLLEIEFLVWEALGFVLKAFHGLDEAYPRFGG